MKTCPKCNQEKLVAEFSKDNSRDDGLLYICRPCNNFQITQRKCSHWEQKLYLKSKENARNKNIEHTISATDIIIPEKCPYLLIPLTRILGKGQQRTNASIDRIDNNKGYTPDNIRIVSRLANTIKNNVTEEQLIEFATNVLRLHEA